MKGLNIKLILDIVMVGGIIFLCGFIYLVIFGCENAYRIKHAAIWVENLLWSVLNHLRRNVFTYLSLSYIGSIAYVALTTVGTYQPSSYSTLKDNLGALLFILTIWITGYGYRKEREEKKHTQKVI